MKTQFNKKIKAAILASILTLSFNSVTNAETILPGSIDFSKEFRLNIEYGASMGSSSNYSYLYYTPVDKTVQDDLRNTVTYKGGVLYLVQGGYDNGYDNTTITIDKVTNLGDAADIFGEGISGKLRKKTGRHKPPRLKG